VHLVYICLRKSLPTDAEQRAACAAAGATAEELAEAYTDDCRPKGEQPQRDYLPGAARPGDVVLVARLGVLATTDAEALRFVAAISEHGAVLRDASTGNSYRVRAEASQDVADGLRLAADMREDERRLVLEKARSHIKHRLGAAPKMSDDDKARASVYWFDKTLTTAEATAKAGFAERALYRALGKRNRPAFGKMIHMRRPKP